MLAVRLLHERSFLELRLERKLNLIIKLIGSHGVLTTKLISQFDFTSKSKSITISFRETFLSWTLIPVTLGGIFPRSIFSNLKLLSFFLSSFDFSFGSTFSMRVFDTKMPTFEKSWWMIELTHSARSWKIEISFKT